MTSYFQNRFQIAVSSRIEELPSFTVVDKRLFVKLYNAPMTNRLLIQFNMKNFKTAYTPLQAELALRKDRGKSVSSKTPYRQLGVALLQLASTVRPDIAYLVNCLSQFLHKKNTQL